MAVDSQNPSSDLNQEQEFADKKTVEARVSPEDFPPNDIHNSSNNSTEFSSELEPPFDPNDYQQFLDNNDVEESNSKETSSKETNEERDEFVVDSKDGPSIENSRLERGSEKAAFEKEVKPKKTANHNQPVADQSQSKPDNNQTSSGIDPLASLHAALGISANKSEQVINKPAKVEPNKLDSSSRSRSVSPPDSISNKAIEDELEETHGEELLDSNLSLENSSGDFEQKAERPEANSEQLSPAKENSFSNDYSLGSDIESDIESEASVEQDSLNQSLSQNLSESDLSLLSSLVDPEVVLADISIPDKELVQQAAYPSPSDASSNDTSLLEPRSADEFSKESNQWAELVIALDLSGSYHQIAQSSIVEWRDDDKILIKVHPNQEILATDSAKSGIEKALIEYFDRKIQVEWLFELPTTETPAMIWNRLAQERHKKACVIVNEHPFVKQLQQHFSAQLDPQSVEYLDE